VTRLARMLLGIAPLLLTAAAPKTLPTPLGSDYSFSVRPAPAPSAGPRYDPAPVPNRDLSAPQASVPNEPTFGPSLFSPKRQFRGDGFSPGSTAQSDQERRMRPAPGFKLSVPVQ
jgi:hypothetical protein